MYTRISSPIIPNLLEANVTSTRDFKNRSAISLDGPGVGFWACGARRVKTHFQFAGNGFWVKVIIILYRSCMRRAFTHSGADDE